MSNVVLYVDDQEEIRQSAQKFLGSKGLVKDFLFVVIECP